MKQHCEICGKPATIHMTEINNGQKLEKHLCEDCAASEGITIKANLPISQLLEDFVLQTPDADDFEVDTPAESMCESCGLSFSEYREEGLLGCPNDYEAFAEEILPMIARAHKGATQHLGKVPEHADKTVQIQNRVLKLRADLKKAVEIENYELAAELRDEIKQIEDSHEIG